MENTPKIIETILEEFDTNQRLFLAGKLHSTRFNKWLELSLTSLRNQIAKEDVEYVKNYQNGFVRDDGTGEPERAPEWQVIEDFISDFIAHKHNQIK